jgi:hypothetical protein
VCCRSGQIARLGALCPLPLTSFPAIQSIPSGAARLWFYRDYEPYETLARPYVRLNEQVAGVSEPGGAFYRDVVPAHYSITVDSAGRDVNQFADVDLLPGQEAYAKILSLRSWLAEDCATWGGCDTFYVRLRPAEAAREDIVPSTAAAERARRAVAYQLTARLADVAVHEPRRNVGENGSS